MATFTETTVETFHVVRCYTCGVPFGITSSMHRRVVQNAKGSVYCPACGSQTCWRESKDQKRIKELTRQLQSADQRLKSQSEATAYQRQQRERAEKRLSATKGVVTRMKNRASKGVCPCCNRHFANLQRHMESQHPNYTSED